MNETYTHLGQDQMQAEVILASASSTGSSPIYTIRIRYPRPIHGEIMTHRVFGRNARSSRAVPVRTMLDEVRTVPYVPWHWGKNQKGMQAGEDLTPDQQVECHSRWLSARDDAANHAEWLMDFGVHKQNPNRLLEPFSWIDTLITSTEWSNFFWLRQHHAAEPHLQDLANLVYQAKQNCFVQHLDEGEWHLPYITEEEKRSYHSSVLLKLSAARCARISYKPFNGDSTMEAELNRYNLLVTDERVHASPLEHQAKPDTIIGGAWTQAQNHGNLRGWIQHRKLIPNEVYQG